jgi:hypothetical protein
MTSPSPAATTALVAPDISAFAKALRKHWVERQARGDKPPSHVELLNLIAKAAGHPNVQALKAAAAKAVPAVRTVRALDVAALTPTAAKAAMQFDAHGRLVRWPTKFSVQRLAMWALWMHFDAKRVYREREVNAVLARLNTFGDHVTLRRELINMKLMSRKSDCSEYRKEPARPTDEVRAFLKVMRQRVREAASDRAGDRLREPGPR